jgi:membrane protease YdiL (CAAX protease family)
MSVYIFAIILLITTLFEAIEGLISTRKYIEKKVTQTQRIKIYKSTILWGWIKTLLCILLFTLLKFPLKEAGFILPKFISENVHFLFGILVYIVSIGLFLMLTYQIIMFRVSSNYRIALSKVMEKKGKMKGVDVMLPTTGLEKKWFRLCAITAGICEEIVFRGFYSISSIKSCQKLILIIF